MGDKNAGWVDVPTGNAAADGDWTDVPHEEMKQPTSGPGAPGSYQNRRGGPVMNANQSPVNAGVQAVERSFGVERPPDIEHGAIAGLKDEFSQAGKSAGRLAMQMAHDPIHGVNQFVEGGATALKQGGDDLAEGLHRRDPRAIATGAGELSPFATGVAEEGLEGAIGEVKPRIAELMRTEGGTGPIRPGAKLATQIAGGTAGAAGGGAVTHGSPFGIFYGGEKGARYAPRLAEAMIPKKNVPFTDPGASLPSSDEFYSRRGADLMKRAEPKAPKVKETPFDIPGATKSTGPLGDARLPTVSTPQEPFPRVAPKASSKVSKGVAPPMVTRLPEGRPTPYRLTPEQVPGRPQLRNLAKGGSQEAGAELQRRGEQVLYEPKGAGYSGVRERVPLSKQIAEEGAKKKGVQGGSESVNNIETDSMGIRWMKSTDGKYRVSIPKRISDAEAAEYAKPKLEEQAKIHGGLAKEISSNKGSETPKSPALEAENKRDVTRQLRQHIRKGGKIHADDSHENIADAIARHETYASVTKHLRGNTLSHRELSNSLEQEFGKGSAPTHEVVRVLRDMQDDGRVVQEGGKWRLFDEIPK